MLLVREYGLKGLKWRTYLLCEKQDGSLCTKRKLHTDNAGFVSAYVFDFTAAAEQFGWERIHAQPGWTTEPTKKEFWHYQLRRETDESEFGTPNLIQLLPYEYNSRSVSLPVCYAGVVPLYNAKRIGALIHFGSDAFNLRVRRLNTMHLSRFPKCLFKLCAHRLEQRALILSVFFASLRFPLISELAPSNAEEKRGIELSNNPTEISQVVFCVPA